MLFPLCFCVRISTIVAFTSYTWVSYRWRTTCKEQVFWCHHLCRSVALNCETSCVKLEQWLVYTMVTREVIAIHFYLFIMIKLWNTNTWAVKTPEYFGGSNLPRIQIIALWVTKLISQKFNDHGKIASSNLFKLFLRKNWATCKWLNIASLWFGNDSPLLVLIAWFLFISFHQWRTDCVLPSCSWLCSWVYDVLVED